MQAGHVFISYVREDADDAGLLQHEIESAGFRVWRDKADLWPGEDWRAKIRHEITSNALVFVACFSRRSLARQVNYQNEELALALEQMRLRPPDQPWFIPVRFDDCDIPDRDIGGGRTLGMIQRADLFGDCYAEEIQRLIATVRRIMSGNAASLDPGRGANDAGAERHEGGQPPAAANRDPVPPADINPLEEACLAPVHDLAPRALIGRDDELAELLAFCAGSDTYQWWQGAPKAGKTALTAWFVLHPPAGVRVVSFFVTSSLADQSDSMAFTDAMIDQLALLAGRPAPLAISAAARDGIRRQLVEDAARRLRERHQRLVMVIDGLDEDTGNRPGSGRASIASLLPRRLPKDVRVLVTSREHPPLPGDVPDDHPLRSCPVVKVRPSPHACALMRDAENELRERLHADGADRDIIALITAIGSGLTVSDLADLTGLPSFELTDRLGTVLGRSLRSRMLHHEQVYLFAHDTLRTAAETILSADLKRYRGRIHDQAAACRHKDWPRDTPAYLFRPYTRMIESAGDLSRLAALAADSARHDRMLLSTGSDEAARRELTTAQKMLTAVPAPELAALITLAPETERFGEPTTAIPAELPAAWACLGHVDRALQLSHRLRALAMTARALAGGPGQASQPELAADLIARIEQVAPSGLDTLGLAPLIDIAVAIASFDPERAVQLIDRTTCSFPPGVDPPPAFAVAVVHAAAGRFDTAIASANRLKHDQRSKALAEIARYLAASDPRRAEHILSNAEELLTPLRAGADDVDTSARATAVAPIVSALALLEPRRAANLADEMLSLCPPLQDFWGFEGLASIVSALVAAKRIDQAEQVARAVPRSRLRARVLAAAAAALASVAEGSGTPAHRQRALRLITEAEETLIASRTWREPSTFAALAEALSAAGHPEQAIQAARHAAAQDRPRVLAVIADALAATRPDLSARLLSEAEQAIDQPHNSYSRRTMYPRFGREARALELAEVALHVTRSHPQTAARLAAEAEKLLASATRHTAAGTTVHEDILVILAHQRAAAGQTSEALRIARSLTGKGRRSQATIRICRVLAETGHIDQAERIAQTISEPREHANALVAIASTRGFNDDRARAARMLDVASELDPSARGSSVEMAVARCRVAPADPHARRHLRHLLARALTSRATLPDSLRDILPALRETAPDAVLALYDWSCPASPPAAS